MSLLHNLRFYLRTIHLWEFDPRRRNLYFTRHISTDGMPTSRINGDGPRNAVRRGVPQASLRPTDIRRLATVQV
ncbi:hypothetical protein M0D69_15915 [Caballeronia sp. SEWSISQ10-4 2]|uniref:hypothetical protein n=1 Tax=Caballeronia sp. SEWSISQ10-4 2 TaxID=2937438 RepID=UPI00264DD95B|nr:hypothetical protein [Caballeronia sp. SEWSISQ10-4 2]MDN7179447.1 hypothetical protein [Caballeronia sp. SEWSISQ10-4 2]